MLQSNSHTTFCVLLIERTSLLGGEAGWCSTNRVIEKANWRPENPEILDR